MSKKTESNLERIKKLEEKSFVDIRSDGIYPHTYTQPINQIVELIIEHLELRYEPKECTKPRVVKVKKLRKK